MTTDIEDNKILEIRRLVIAKKLYLHGCSHASNKDEISRMLAIHHFDNASEIVLKCVATNCKVVSSSKHEYKYKDLWNEFLKKDINLPLKDQMFSLHDLRNIIQHQGDIPPVEAIIKYKGYVEDFFKKVSIEIFNIPYEKLYLSQLIKNETLKEKLFEAETAIEKREFKQCIMLCDDVLMSATFEDGDIFTTAGMLIGYWGASGELNNVIKNDYPEKFKEKEFYEPVKHLSKAILQLGQAATGMQFLDEYRIDFLKQRQIIETLDDITGKDLNESAVFSLNFATNLILKWQEEGIFRDQEI
jgi:hypothetical protein